MTTEVLIRANHGWPVKVTCIHTKIADGGRSNHTTVVPAGHTQTFFVFDGCDISVHEMQPAEAEAARELDRAQHRAAGEKFMELAYSPETSGDLDEAFENAFAHATGAHATQAP